MLRAPAAVASPSSTVSGTVSPAWENAHEYPAIPLMAPSAPLQRTSTTAAEDHWPGVWVGELTVRGLPGRVPSNLKGPMWPAPRAQLPAPSAVRTWEHPSGASVGVGGGGA